MLSERRNKLNDQFNELVDKINRKYYEEQEKPIYDTRKKVIDGELDDKTKETLPKFDVKHTELVEKVKEVEEKEKASEEEPEKEHAQKTPTDVSYLKDKQGVPDFWSRILGNST